MLETRVAKLEKEMHQLQAHALELRDATVEHRIRLENGTKVIGEHRDKLKEVDEEIAKARERNANRVSKLVSWVGAVLLSAGSALWGLSDRFARLDAEQVTQREDIGNLEKKLDLILEKLAQ